MKLPLELALQVVVATAAAIGSVLLVNSNAIPAREKFSVKRTAFSQSVCSFGKIFKRKSSGILLRTKSRV
jgi:hypothetical protein